MVGDVGVETVDFVDGFGVVRVAEDVFERGAEGVIEEYAHVVDCGCW